MKGTMKKTIYTASILSLFWIMAVATSEEESSSAECVVGHWLWPSTSNYSAAMKFNEDGSWNSSNTIGPASFYGTWEIEGDKIIVEVTSSTSGLGLGEKIYYLDGCDELKEGSTVWYKD